MKWLFAAAGALLIWKSRAQAAAVMNMEAPLYGAENWIYEMTGARMNISLAGLALIKQAEGLALKPYKDAAGFWTVGYGHKLQSGEWWDSISKADADALLAKGVTGAEDAVNSLVNVPITQGQFDALVSFTYNLGTGALKKSTLLAKVNAGDASAAAEFGRWVYAGGQQLAGLVTRRANEARLFAEGVA